jgi:hypothetical protein
VPPSPRVNSGATRLEPHPCPTRRKFRIIAVRALFRAQRGRRSPDARDAMAADAAAGLAIVIRSFERRGSCSSARDGRYCARRGREPRIGRVDALQVFREVMVKPIRRPETEAVTERSLHATAPAAMTYFKIPIRRTRRLTNESASAIIATASSYISATVHGCRAHIWRGAMPATTYVSGELDEISPHELS